MKKTFNIGADVLIRKNAFLKKGLTYTVAVQSHEEALKILQASKILQENGEIGEPLSLVNSVVLQRSCCRRSFIRGAFLAAGSISDPEKFYHFEIVCPSRDRAEQVQGIIKTFGIDAKMVVRKKYFVVYIKEGA